MKLFILSGEGFYAMIPHAAICANSIEEAKELLENSNIGYMKVPRIELTLPYKQETEPKVLGHWEIHS